MLTIAADPKHLGARIGITVGAAHLGLGAHPPSACAHDRAGRRHLARRRGWVSCRPRYLLPVEVLSALFRRLFLEKLAAAHAPASCSSSAIMRELDDEGASPPIWHHCARSIGWSTPSARSAGPRQVLRYLSRYTHRVAISNRRLVAADENGVTFKWKDYRIEGPARYKTMTLTTDEFIRRFLMHVLPEGFHRIRHYGLLASGNRAANIAHARKLLAMPSRPIQPDAPEAAPPTQPRILPRPCPCCGGRMIIIESLRARLRAQHHPQRLRQQSGSTPHDAVTADQRPPSRSPVVPALRRQRPRSWLAANCAALAPPISANNPPPARSPLQPRPCLQANRSQQALRSLILLPDLAAKSP